MKRLAYLLAQFDGNALNLYVGETSYGENIAKGLFQVASGLPRDEMFFLHAGEVSTTQQIINAAKRFHNGDSVVLHRQNVVCHETNAKPHTFNSEAFRAINETLKDIRAMLQAEVNRFTRAKKSFA